MNSSQELFSCEPSPPVRPLVAHRAMIYCGPDTRKIDFQRRGQKRFQCINLFFSVVRDTKDSLYMSLLLWRTRFQLRLRTLWRFGVNKVRRCSEHEFLQDDSEAVDVSFLSSVDRSSCHTQQLRCCPQLITVILELILLSHNHACRSLCRVLNF